MWSRVHRYSRPSLPHQNPQTDERGVSSLINKLTFALLLFSQEVGSIIGKVSDSFCSRCPCCWLTRFRGCVLRFYVTIGFAFFLCIRLFLQSFSQTFRLQSKNHRLETPRMYHYKSRCFLANGLLNATSRKSYVLMIWMYCVVKFYI